MAKVGGARVGAGRPVDPNSRRQAGVAGKPIIGWTTIPFEYDGEIPAWPLPDATKGVDDEPDFETMEREEAVWESLWMTGQAEQWIKRRMFHDVAIYVRLLVAGERGNTKALAEARHWKTIIGLSAAGMAALKWQFPSEPKQQQQTTLSDTGGSASSTKTKPKPSMRDRLNEFEGGK